MNISLPPFPNHIPTHPLLVVDYKLLQAGNEQKIERGCQVNGVLVSHGTDLEANEMFDVGEGAMAIPVEEKFKFGQGGALAFGYKPVGTYFSAKGESDAIEFLNIGKDDVIAWPQQATRAYPPAVNAQMESTVIPFVRKSLGVTRTIMDIFNEKLGLPVDTLMKSHILEEPSGAEVRITRAPPFTQHVSLNGLRTGDLWYTFLYNRLGGPQVMPPGSETWQYIKPVPSYAICNISDALSIFSGGILRSNLHRVVPAPGPQGNHPRLAVLYFLRPSYHVALRALVEDSPMIAEAVKMTPERNFETGSTTKVWVERRVKYSSMKDRTDPDIWLASRGTEPLEFRAKALRNRA